MPIKWIKTKYVGVRYRESDIRKDKCYCIRYSLHGVEKVETVGWFSEGMSAQYAAQIRGQIVSNIKLGKKGGFQSVEEMRQMEKAERDNKAAGKVALEKENTPFSDLAERYLEWSKTSKKSCRDDISRYKYHIEPVLGDIPIKDVSVIDLERLKRKTKEKGLAPNTVKHVLTLTRQIFNKAIGWNEYAKENPVRATLAIDKKFLKIPDNKRNRYLTHEEADLLLSTLAGKSLQTRDIALLSLYSGLRMGEIFNLKWSDINLQNENIHIKDAKSGESRTAYITAPIKEMLERRMSENPGKSELIFKNHKGEKILELSNTFQSTVDALGFNKGIADPRDKVIGHTLRHTFASWLAMAGTPIITIQRLMGHKSIEMTLRYAHLSPSHERDAVVRLADRQGAKVLDSMKGAK